MTLLVSVLGSVIISVIFFAVLNWVKTPHYRPDANSVRRLLQWVLLEQATENDWRIFCDYPIRHDELLESIREQCAELEELHYIGPPRLLNKEGIAEIRRLLELLDEKSPANKN